MSSSDLLQNIPMTLWEVHRLLCMLMLEEDDPIASPAHLLSGEPCLKHWNNPWPTDIWELHMDMSQICDTDGDLHHLVHHPQFQLDGCWRGSER